MTSAPRAAASASTKSVLLLTILLRTTQAAQVPTEKIGGTPGIDTSPLRHVVLTDGGLMLVYDNHILRLSGAETNRVLYELAGYQPELLRFALERRLIERIVVAIREMP